MKFTAATIALITIGAEAFDPVQTSSPLPLARPASATVTTSSSALNLFGSNWLKQKAFNSNRPAEAKKSLSDINEKEVRALFELWNSALATGDSRIVASRYTKDPVLLATVSDQPRTDYASVKDYFDAFLQKKPQGKIINGKVTIGDGWASDAGLYEFTMGATGDKVKARYTYNYVQENGIWKIQHHHSSVLPEQVLGKPITEDEVRGLFSLWNNALKTLEPKKYVQLAFRLYF